MNPPGAVDALASLLSRVPRRYRLPALHPPAAASPGQTDALQKDGISNALALYVEHARQALRAGVEPDESLRCRFLDALARMINDAMQHVSGDPVIQAMVLRHRSQTVRDYASLAAEAAQHRRHVETLVNAIAHPAKLQQVRHDHQRDALLRLQVASAAQAWERIGATARQLLAGATELGLGHAQLEGVKRLSNNAALRYLARMAALEKDPDVQRYHALKEQNGPRSNSPLALEQGAASKQRGAEVETLSAEALQAVADWLNASAAGDRPYRVVTSMRVPAAFPADPDGAKSEWDTVLLRRDTTDANATRWDICLLAEAKASIDSVGTDLPRLLRGLRLLAQADRQADYAFRTREGSLNLRGASLAALPTDPQHVEASVVYCCDVEQDTNPRLLSAAARMQLLSTPASLEYAAALADTTGPTPSPEALAGVWTDLLHEARWRGVLNQYPTLHLARELTVNVHDLIDTARRLSHTGRDIN